MKSVGNPSLKRYRDEHRAAGLCLECCEPVAMSLRGKLGVMCQRHRESHSASWKARCHKKNGVPKLLALDSFMTLSPSDLAYAAALLDGEGHVNLANRDGKKEHIYSPVVAIGMTDREPLDFMASLFGGNIWIYYPKRGNRKPYWHWARRGRVAAAIAKAVLPYLKIERKRHLAELMVAYGATIGKVNHWRVDFAVDVWRERMDVLGRLHA